jgi:hypothetical protein
MLASRCQRAKKTGSGGWWFHGKNQGKPTGFSMDFNNFLDCSLIVFTMKCRMLSCDMVPFSLKLGLRDRERAGFGILVRGHSL